ncbi:FecR family protein [Mangrovibacterium marinum]|uniref:FecR family protein n=1 Tax=Mangrovibacterium marinum TaxID=1639118 RepID=A0A2T5BVW7_9BACT|nr:FecR family protein [Mangrovibacterium marinum]PTN03789.1 FecR family protein [Mangrovibacterium marinum]
MKADQSHKDHQAVDNHSKSFFSGGTFRWGKSQDQIRTELLHKIADAPIVRRLPVARLSIAATIIVLAAVTSFLRFYSTTITVPAGKHQTAMLPDGSQVELNAESELTYYPLWWTFQRTLKFEGEGFFKVEKGKTFSVSSALGTTQVLGTSFNIFSREEVYRVTCVTGKVRVGNSPDNQVILLPNHQAEILENGQIRLNKQVDLTTEITWKNNIFLFTATPIRQVFKEIERQYAVTIELEANTHDLYTGNFNRTSKIEEVLSFVCPAAGLKFEKKSANVYLIRNAWE